MSRIVIGDVHGCYKTLMALIAKLPPGIPITFVGDLVDRGGQSRDVVKYVIENGHDCVKGNHEDMMVDYADDKDPNKRYTSIFASNGGLRTLQSYDYHPAEFAAHVEWMRNLPLYLEYPECKRESDGRYLVVSHSAIGTVWKARNNPDKAKYLRDHVLWERNRFLDAPEIYNIFGHTPQEMEATVKSFYANVDTGAVFARDWSEIYGRMTAIQYPEMITYVQENIEHE
jgi:serine/threonine protein phosphatase 1